MSNQNNEANPQKKVTNTAPELLAIKSAEDLRSLLEENIFEQPHAIEEIVKNHRRIAAGLIRHDKPLASFLFLGSTGTGKTELARLWAHFLGWKFKRFDMSEFSEEHTASAFLGSPVGYIGSDKPSRLSVLTGGPFVVLLDEVEKAHPDVLRIFLQCLDAGHVTDRSGKDIDFTNGIILMTSNAATSIPNKIGLNIASAEEFLNEIDRKSRLLGAVSWAFPQEFLGRIQNIVFFNRLSNNAMQNILNKGLKDIEKLAGMKIKNLKVAINQTLSERLVAAAVAENMGARPIVSLLERVVVTRIALELTSTLKDATNGTILVSLPKEASHYDLIEIGRQLSVEFKKSDNKTDGVPATKKLSEERKEAPQQLAAARSTTSLPDETGSESPPLPSGYDNTFVDKEKEGVMKELEDLSATTLGSAGLKLVDLPYWPKLTNMFSGALCRLVGKVAWTLPRIKPRYLPVNYDYTTCKLLRGRNCIVEYLISEHQTTIMVYLDKYTFEMVETPSDFSASRTEIDFVVKYHGKTGVINRSITPDLFHKDLPFCSWHGQFKNFPRGVKDVASLLAAITEEAIT